MHYGFLKVFFFKTSTTLFIVQPDKYVLYLAEQYANYSFYRTRHFSRFHILYFIAPNNHPASLYRFSSINTRFTIHAGHNTIQKKNKNIFIYLIVRKKPCKKRFSRIVDYHRGELQYYYKFYP